MQRHDSSLQLWSCTMVAAIIASFLTLCVLGLLISTGLLIERVIRMNDKDYVFLIGVTCVCVWTVFVAIDCLIHAVLG